MGRMVSIETCGSQGSVGRYVPLLKAHISCPDPCALMFTSLVTAQASVGSAEVEEGDGCGGGLDVQGCVERDRQTMHTLAISNQ